jgi:hypothetical protein
MPVRYDKQRDVLKVILSSEAYDSFSFEGGDFEVRLNEEDKIVAITISQATRFISQALAAGVKIEGGPDVKPAQGGMVWYDADSSMISAFGYDETEGVLEVAFHTSGVYRYHDVPLDVFEGLRDASSKGSYLRNMIFDVYPYEKKRGRSRR